MDMATDNLEEGIEVTPEAFKDLEKRLAKAEKKLAKAKSVAQQTTQEIWQLDVQLKEEQERANAAEAKLAELEGGGEVDEEALAAAKATIGELQDEIELLRDELKNAREEATEAEELRALVTQLQEQVQSLEQRLAEASESTSEAATEELERLQSRVQELELEKLSLETDARERISELEADLAQAEPDEETAQLLTEAQERISELETALAEAGSDAALTEELEEARRRIEELESRPSEGEGEQSADLELAEARLGGLRIALHEAEERAREAEEKLSTVGGSTGVFEEQLEAIQEKVKEAEERALEWEERYHKSEEKLAQVEEAASGGGESSMLVMELQDRISELETELTELRLSSEAPSGDSDLDELRAELMQAQDRVSELESQGGVSLEEYQRLEKELEEFQGELEEANKRAEEAQKRADEAGGESDNEIIQSLRQRLELADERAELLQTKAEQAAEKLDLAKSNSEDLREERERLGQELEKLRTETNQLKERLAKEEGQAQAVGLSSAATQSKMQEALQRARDAELKANQAEVKLQKAMDSLAEYEQRANESDRETQRLAFQDGLTGLPNLNLIRQYLEFTVKQVQRYSRASALLVVDLDRFKLINDAMGFKAGDELLSKVAERLQTAIRESDALGRKGEDEFLILLSELITGDDSTAPEQKTNMIRQNIAIVVNRISECLSRPFQIQGQKFYIRASIGVSICPNDADSAQAMLEHADSAMYHAKESGRGRCVFYNSELHKKQERRLTMDSQLRLAMEKGEFVLQYQPIIEMKKGKGQIVGVEALLRWNHRIDGLLEPSKFLNIAEETGLIVQLGQWVCRQACWQLRQWLSQGHNMFISFNVSTRQMLQADLAEMILGSVEEFGLSPGLVFVEIAEGTNVEQVDLIERVVTNLGKAGIRVAIDDFGVGYSSISRIDLDNIQFLKIDPSLVHGCQQDKAKANICEAAVRLADSLALSPLAEGVETLAQAKFLTKVGCQFLQGYHIQAPAGAEVITNLLNEKRAWKF